MTVQTWLIDMPADECERLLAGVALGRVGVIVEGRPEIFPVNHVFDPVRRCVAFPTNRGTKLRAALEWPWVAYEVDGVEAGDEGGWSVSIVGRAEELTDVDEIARLEQQRRVLWRTGAPVQWLRIVPSKMTGRRISAVAR